MRGQRQVTRYTKTSKPDKTESTDKTNNQNERRHYILITAYEMKNTMYTDQTGKFIYSSSWGNRYNVNIHDIDSNDTWAEYNKI